MPIWHIILLCISLRQKSEFKKTLISRDLCILWFWFNVINSIACAKTRLELD
jgi:hypothetical protein